MEDPGFLLEKESYNLAMLKDTVSKSSQLSTGMCSILTSFDEHLMKLEQTILPVYHETGNLQRRQENIEKTLEKLDYVIQFFNVSKEVEPVIRDGPKDCLDKYLESLGKLQSAIKFFENSNPNSQEYDELTSLFDVGGDALQREFRALLSKHSRPVSPVKVLDLLGMDEEMPNDEEKVSIEQLPESVIKELTQIGQWLRRHRNEDFANIYATIRSNILSRSIQNLKDHQKNNSGNSSTLTVQNSPLLGNRRSIAKDTPPRRTPKKIQQMFMKKATAVLAKYSPTVESTGLGHRLQTALLPESKDEIPDHEFLAFTTSISALLKLMQSELQLMQGIIPRAQQKTVFERVVNQAMENLITEGESLVSRVKRCVSRHEFSTALNLFPILRHLMSVKTEFENLFQGCSAGLHSKLQGLIITLQATISKTLEEFIESIKNDPDTKMPKDGTVHELTSNAMMLLVQLQEYPDILGSVLTRQDTSFSTSKDSGKVAFAQYITRVLSALGLTLQNKSESYSDPHLKAIFRINNLHYILKALQRTNLLEIVHAHAPNVESSYNESIKEQKRIYSQSWSRVLHFVMEVEKPISQQTLTQGSSLKLRDKDRENIKQKFAGFNKEIEEIYRIQKAYAIPDVELRETLKRDNKEFILQKYAIFYDKYLNTSFTKNPEKYLKYKPADVSNMIDNFFDAAA